MTFCVERSPKYLMDRANQGHSVGVTLTKRIYGSYVHIFMPKFALPPRLFLDRVHQPPPTLLLLLSDKLSVLTTPTQKKQRGKSPDTPETFRYSLDVSPTAHKSKYRVKITHRTKGATTPPSRDLPLLLAKSSPSRSQNLRPHSQISPPAPILCPNTVTNVSGWSPSDALIIALFFRSSRH